MGYVDKDLLPCESAADDGRLHWIRYFGAGFRLLNTDASNILDAIATLGGSATSLQIGPRIGGVGAVRINAAVDHLERYRLVKVARGAGGGGLNFTAVRLESHA
jgi:hypothetical protein